MDGCVAVVGYEALDDVGLALEKDVEDFGALRGAAVVVDDDAGGGVVDADLCARSWVSVASSSRVGGLEPRDTSFE